LTYNIVELGVSRIGSQIFLVERRTIEHCLWKAGHSEFNAL
jgi:hypothetical protein